MEDENYVKLVQSFVLINKKIIDYTKKNAQSLGLTITQMGN
ncbi:MAG: hypothetical protein ACRC57_15245 [Sarcina sp.]